MSSPQELVLARGNSSFRHLKLLKRTNYWVALPIISTSGTYSFRRSGPSQKHEYKKNLSTWRIIFSYVVIIFEPDFIYFQTEKF